MANSHSTMLPPAIPDRDHALACCARCNAKVQATASDVILICDHCSTLTDVREFLKRDAHWQAQEKLRADAARKRFEARKHRLAREEALRQQRLAARSAETPSANAMPDAIRAALERVKNR